MTARLLTRPALLVSACVAGLLLGLSAAPAWAPPAGSAGRDNGVITANAREFDVKPGDGQVHGPANGFDSASVFFIQVTGADENVEVLFKDGTSNKMVLRGEGRSGIGQEDYVITLPTPINITEVEVRCISDNPGPCRLFVHLVGTS